MEGEEEERENENENENGTKDVSGYSKGTTAGEGAIYGTTEVYSRSVRPRERREEEEIVDYSSWNSNLLLLLLSVETHST